MDYKGTVKSIRKIGKIFGILTEEIRLRDSNTYRINQRHAIQKKAVT